MTRWAEVELTGWGRVHRARCLAARPERLSELASLFAQDANGPSEPPLLAHGAGRSYGDAGLISGGRAVITRRLDRFLDFNRENGVLVAEPGVSFADILETFLPLGFAPPVVPGTGFATLGGGVANDVHGKNHHHAGSLGRHIEWLDLRLPSGEVRRLTEADGPLWKATIGGLGLTGFIERVALRMKRVASNALRVRKRRIANLDEFLQAFADEHQQSEYVVGWIDALARGRSLGRGILETAVAWPESIPASRARIRRVPFDFPSFALNGATVRAFNALYWRHVPAAGTDRTMSYTKFLFPLDAIHDWNRIYGRRGFHQFQCVLPAERGGASLRAMLECISDTGQGSFLAVLKALGDAGQGYLSFPVPGHTLALDFPNAPGSLALIARLERMTADAGGRVYLAEDGSLPADLVPAMYPELEHYRGVLEAIDPRRRMGSDLARRLRLRGSPA